MVDVWVTLISIKMGYLINRITMNLVGVAELLILLQGLGNYIHYLLTEKMY